MIILAKGTKGLLSQVKIYMGQYLGPFHTPNLIETNLTQVVHHRLIQRRIAVSN